MEIENICISDSVVCEYLLRNTCHLKVPTNIKDMLFANFLTLSL